MAQTIKRKAKGVRRAAAARGNAQKVRKAKAKTGSFLDWVMRFVPFTEDQLQRGFLLLILGSGAALALFVARLAGVPEMVQYQLSLLAKDAGFEVVHVEVRGVERLNQLKVYEKALGLQERAMPLVDLGMLREDVLQLSWVEDARVSRQLPNTLVIDIIERKPHAVLRKPGRLMLIDHTGVELEPVSADQAGDMLVIEGPGANRQVEALSKLLDTAPALQPHVAEAEWIGNRRWNIKFTTGQVLALPQGEEKAAAALITFAQMEGVNQLLGGKAVAFDMRNPDRVYMRIPGRSQMQAVEQQEAQ